MAEKGMGIFTHNGEDFYINDWNGAPEFSAQANYDIGTLVAYKGQLWRFKVRHPAGAWNNDHVYATHYGYEIADLKSALFNMNPSGDLTYGAFYHNGYYKSYTNGNIGVNSNYCYSNMIPVVQGSKYIVGGNSSDVHVCFFDKNYGFVSGALCSGGSATTLTFGATAAYMTVSCAIADQNALKVEWVYKYGFNNSGLTKGVITPANAAITLPDFNNAEFGYWYTIHGTSGTIPIANMPDNEPGVLMCLDSNYEDYAAHQIYFANTGIVYTRYYGNGGWSPWVGSNQSPSPAPTPTPTGTTYKPGLMYSKKLTSAAAGDFAGSPTFAATGMTVPKSIVYLAKMYLIENRTMRCRCKFGADTVAAIGTTLYGAGTYETKFLIDVVNQTIKLNDFESESCAVLNNTDWFMFKMSKEYQTLAVEVINMKTGEKYSKQFVKSGSGGYGSGAVAVDNGVPMQHDYYSFETISGTNLIVSEMSVKTDPVDIVFYGDSITEPEGYYPHDDFDDAWTQLIISASSQKVASAGRGGFNIQALSQAINDELQYTGAKYCAVTIGTNGGNTVSNLTSLIEKIQSYGIIPLLNHIPCYNNNGDTSSFRSVNADIDTVRAAKGIRGCNFDIATSVAGDGQSVDITKMYKEDYGAEGIYYHHPNPYGSLAMYIQAQNDIPEVF